MTEFTDQVRSLGPSPLGNSGHGAVPISELTLEGL